MNYSQLISLSYTSANVVYLAITCCLLLNMNAAKVNGFLSQRSSSIIRTHHPSRQSLNVYSNRNQRTNNFRSSSKIFMLREDESKGRGSDGEANTNYYPDSEWIKEEEETQNEELFRYIYTEVNRMRLEEANTRQFLKSRPAKFCYRLCREWVIAHQDYYSDRNGKLWRDKEDWEAWVSLGGKPSLVPSEPESHYRRLGHWISWDHFLGLDEEEDVEINGDDDCPL